MKPLINITSTIYTTDGAEFVLDANFDFPNTTLRYFVDPIIVCVKIDPRNAKTIKVYTHNSYNRIEAGKILKKIAGKFIQSHDFYDNGIGGMLAIENQIMEDNQEIVLKSVAKENQDYKKSLKNYTDLLNAAVAEERYKDAARYRDIIENINEEKEKEKAK